MQMAMKPVVDPQVPKRLKKWRAVATRFRKTRFDFFKSLLPALSRPLTILDVGGTQQYWETMECIEDDLKITIHNWKRQEVRYPNFTSVVGDARDMHEFTDKEFDIVFSNSVIEHVGTFEHQRQMAQEVQRVAKRYYVQTPNRYFPIEPHYMFPFFQFLPINVRVFLIAHFNLGWRKKLEDKQKARESVSRVRLMTEKELQAIFPEAKIYKEKFLGLTKSLTVYKGW